MAAIHTTAGRTRRFDSLTALSRAVAAARQSWALRTDQPWLTLVAVPLAMTATGLIGDWWLWVPLAGGAAACSPTWRWTWVLSLQLAVIGTEWAYVGAVWLGMWPNDRFLVGLAWTGSMVVLATVGLVNRRYQSLPERRIRL